jgi:hypothetical protein
MIDDYECGAVRGMRSTRRKPARVAMSTTNPTWAALARNSAAEVGSRRLAVWATARPFHIVMPTTSFGLIWQGNVNLHWMSLLNGAWEIFRLRHFLISLWRVFSISQCPSLCLCGCPKGLSGVLTSYFTLEGVVRLLPSRPTAYAWKLAYSVKSLASSAA